MSLTREKGLPTYNDIEKMSLSEEYSSFYVLNPIGNDPIIDTTLIKSQHGRIGFIGKGGLRSLQLALELNGSEANKSNQPPIIFIIDPNICAFYLWAFLKEIAQKEIDSFELLIQCIDGEIKKRTDLFSHYPFVPSHPNNTTKYPEQNVVAFLTELNKIYGFELLIRTLASTTPIRHAWANLEIIKQVKSYFDKLNISPNAIYAYPSNIIAALKVNSVNNDIIRQKIGMTLENIKWLNPEFAIHTDIGYDFQAQNVFIVKNHDVATLNAIIIVPQKEKMLLPELSDHYNEMNKIDGYTIKYFDHKDQEQPEIRTILYTDLLPVETNINAKKKSTDEKTNLTAQPTLFNLPTAKLSDETLRQETKNEQGKQITAKK